MTELNTDALRFYIADEHDRPRSSLWRAFCHGDDVYLAPRKIGGALKLSIHRDGNCQYGTTRHYVQKARAQGIDAFPPLARWRRPPTPESGAFHVASILFPTDFLRSRTIARPTKLKFAIPLAPLGHAIEVMVFYASAEPSLAEQALRERGITAFSYMTLLCGEIAILAARQVPFEAEFIPDLKSMAGQMRPLLGAPALGEKMSGLHAVLMHKKPVDGEAIHLAEINGISVGRVARTERAVAGTSDVSKFLKNGNLDT